MDEGYESELTELKSRVDTLEQAIEKLADNILKLDTMLTQIVDTLVPDTDNK